MDNGGRHARSAGCSRATRSRPAVRPHLQARPGVARQGAGRADPRTRLEVVDTHHHLWDMPGYRYLLRRLAGRLSTGHKVVATVFEECRAMYRARGSGGDEAGRRGRVLRRRGGDERQRQLRADARLRRHRRPCRPHAGRSRGAGARGRDRRRRRPLQGIRIRRRLGRRSGDRQQPRRQGAGRASQRRFPRRHEAAVRRSACRSMPGSSIRSSPR